MGRAPCCEKVGLKKGRWTTEEDEILINYIQANGEGSWRSLPKNAGLLRCGKSCRLRWINYLRSDLKRGNITKEEEDVIIKLHATLGNRWSLIAAYLPGRTDNEIKNYWNSHLSRRVDTWRRLNASVPVLFHGKKFNGGGKRKGGRGNKVGTRSKVGDFRERREKEGLNGFVSGENEERGVRDPSYEGRKNSTLLTKSDEGLKDIDGANREMGMVKHGQNEERCREMGVVERESAIMSESLGLGLVGDVEREGEMMVSGDEGESLLDLCNETLELSEERELRVVSEDTERVRKMLGLNQKECDMWSFDGDLGWGWGWGWDWDWDWDWDWETGKMMGDEREEIFSWL